MCIDPCMSWTPPSLVVTVVDKQHLPAAQQLANKIGLPVMPATMPATECFEDHWQLQLDANHVRIVRPDGLAITVDFINSKAQRRSNEHNILQQPLAKALGIKAFQKRRKNPPTVIDGTAGLGQDAWLMARLGCNVTLLEQSSVLSTLLDFAIEKALAHGDYQPTAKLLSVKHVNASEYLVAYTDHAADIVFLDPMYPARRKQALVKKEMQMLHELIGPDTNNHQLLHSALDHARYRVVVKRPKNAEPLTGTDEWSGQLTSVSSANTRFDIYHVGL